MRRPCCGALERVLECQPRAGIVIMIVVVGRLEVETEDLSLFFGGVGGGSPRDADAAVAAHHLGRAAAWPGAARWARSSTRARGARGWWRARATARGAASWLRWRWAPGCWRRVAPRGLRRAGRAVAWACGAGEGGRCSRRAAFRVLQLIFFVLEGTPVRRV